MVLARFARRVHELDRQVDALGRGVGAPRGHDVFFAQDRRAAVHYKTGALIGIGDDAFPDQDALATLELDPKRHGRDPCRLYRTVSVNRTKKNGGAYGPAVLFATFLRFTGTGAARSGWPARRAR